MFSTGHSVPILIMPTVVIIRCFVLVLVLYFYTCAFVTGDSSTNSVTPQYMDSLLKLKKYQEFANILQIENVDLVDPSQRKSGIQEQIFYSGILLADILLRPGQLLNPGDTNDFNGNLKLSINKWKNGTVPYYISNTFLDNQTHIIKKQIKYVNHKLGPNVHFRDYQDGDNDYVLFYNGGCGCYSNLGNVGGPQVISLTDNCFKFRFPAHEMQHTLGFTHEYNRIDRNDYLQVVTENIPEVLKTQYEKYSADNMVNTGPFDYYSMMMIPVNVPGFNSTAMNLYQDGLNYNEVGKVKHLTPTDVRRVKKLYN